MKNLVKTSLATAILMSSAGVCVQAAESGNAIINNIKVSGELRPRYERVDEDNTKANANAFTNRTVIGVNADLFGTSWLSGFVQMTDVHALNNNYNSTDNGQAGSSVVADPGQTRLTQSYLDFKYNKTIFRAGRQIVNLDNLRFIGSVNWRQMPQSFNAYAVVDNSIDKLNLLAAYVTQVNTIKAGNSAGNSDSSPTKTILLHARYKMMDAVTLTGYGYLIGSIHNTYGLALTGKSAFSDSIKYNYRAEYASQNDPALETQSQGKPHVDANYFNLQLGLNMSGFLAGAQYELLSGSNGSDNKTAFSTPLATLHAHNGWADEFLKTPTQGLVDVNVMVGYKTKSLGVVKAVYHDFSSDKKSINYGTEFDLLYKKSIPNVKNLTGLVKAAFYRGGDSVAQGNTAKLATDKKILWVMLDYKFSQ